MILEDRLLWMWRRLRVMAPREIASRTGRALSVRFERYKGRPRPVPQPRGASAAPWHGEMGADIQPASYVEAARAILAGKIPVFAVTLSGFPPAWNRCPKTGLRSPLKYGKTINYRDEAVVGDIKYLWEQNRHLELVTVAQAWRLTGEAEFGDGSKTLLLSWFDSCPYPLGPNWTSSLEHAIRLTNWSIAWHLLGGDASPLFEGLDGDLFRTRWLESVYRHLQFISGHLSFYSSANNHLLGEYMGLFLGSLTWPLWQETKDWEQLGRGGFEAETMRQNAEDGVNREQAIYYQHEVLTMMLLAGVAAGRSGVDFSKEFWQRLEAMLEFIAALMDVNGHVPMIGDADDGKIVRLDPTRTHDTYRWLLAAGAVIYERGDMAVKAGQLSDATRWLLPGCVLPPLAPAEPRLSFPQGGYYLLGYRLGKPDEIRLICDCGPLGYLSIAAHGHADALSFTLSADGHEWLIDPGTFAFHTGKAWRNHFRGTGAHNTVLVDGIDQSEIGGNFLWIRKAQSTLIVHDPLAGVFEGEHNGYQRLRDPLQHRRRIEFDGPARTIKIIDTLECQGLHEIGLSFQFAEACEVTIFDGKANATRDGSILELECTHSLLSPTLFLGNVDPVAGWVSRKFDAKVPAPMVRWAGAIEGTTRIETFLRLRASH